MTAARLLLPLLALVAAAASAQVEPPPLPPEPAPPPGPEPPEVDPSLDSSGALGRYQDCFQRMVDAAANDNTFMRRCLGLSDAPPKSRKQSGALTADDVRGVVKKRGAELDECYGKLLQQTKAMGLTPEGTVEARLKIAASGKVESVGFDPTSITDVGLLGCFRDRLSVWTFRKTGDGADAHMTFRLRAKPQRAPSVALAKGSPKLSGAAYGLSAGDVLAVFRKNVPSLRRCYDELQKRKPGSRGQVSVNLLVSPKGQVAKVSLGDLAAFDGAFKGCLGKAFRRWRFPPPGGGEAVPVSYPPIDFSPQPEPPPQ